MIHKMGKYPGLTGLFTSAMFSGALSTASSGNYAFISHNIMKNMADFEQ